MDSYDSVDKRVNRLSYIHYINLLRRLTRPQRGSISSSGNGRVSSSSAIDIKIDDSKPRTTYQHKGVNRLLRNERFIQLDFTLPSFKPLAASGNWQLDAGKILDPVQGWTTHHSIVEFQGKWYLFYHDTSLSDKNHLRCVKVRELVYDEQGHLKCAEPQK